MLIYKVTNKTNGNVYIGQTTLSLEKRRYKHEQESASLIRKTVKFHNALLKYGFNNFTWEVVKECNSQEELDYFEKYYIKLYNACDRETGYNLKYGGRSGGIFTEEAKEHLGDSTKLKWKNPTCRAKMLEGLRKGTETVKKKAANNFVSHICPQCGTLFKTKNWNSRRYCSRKCMAKDLHDNLVKSSHLAAEQAIKRYAIVKENRLKLILEWLSNNKSIVENAKLNDLKFLKKLALFIGVKDTRSLGKVLGLQYKKEIVTKLKDMIKCTPNCQMNKSEYNKEETPRTTE